MDNDGVVEKIEMDVHIPRHLVIELCDWREDSDDCPGCLSVNSTGLDTERKGIFDYNSNPGMEYAFEAWNIDGEKYLFDPNEGEHVTEAQVASQLVEAGVPADKANELAAKLASLL